MNAASHCSIIVDRSHLEEFAEQVSIRADKRYLMTAVDKWREEPEYDYLLVLEDESDLTEITFVTPQAFARSLVDMFERLDGCVCLWILMLSSASQHRFNEVFVAEEIFEAPHRLQHRLQ